MDKGTYHYEYGTDGKKHRVYDVPSPGTSANYNAPRISKKVKVKGGGQKQAYYPRVAWQPAMKGTGSYYNSSFVRSMRKALPKGSFAQAGSMMAGPLGGWAGSQLAKIAGFGDYKVTSNSLIGEGQSPAAMHSTKDITIVRHREYICDIVSAPTPNTFENQVYDIQPGLPSSFPWLAPIAQQFEQYMVRGMVYEFKTLYSDAIVMGSLTGSIGGVIMATDYNVLNNPFSSKQQMDNTQYTTSAKPSVSFYHPIECKPGSAPTNQLFIRSGNQPGDQRLYDLGQFQVATFGIPTADTVLGELWCSYEIEFSKPINDGATANLQTDHFRLGTVSNAAPLGTTSVAGEGSSLGGSINSAGTTYQFPVSIQEGQYLVVLSWIGASTAATTTPSLNFTGCSVQALWNNDSSSAAISASGLTTTNVLMSFIISIDSASPSVNGASFALSGATLPTSISGADLFVTEIDSDISS